MNTIMARQRIMARASTCKCGCRGRDSWHRSWYTRSVTVDPTDPTRGTVRLPQSTQPVVVVRGPQLGGFAHGPAVFIWNVDRSSIINDK